ncbi:MAG: tetratricopeptide repeat protein, partial [bacterium]
KTTEDTLFIPVVYFKKAMVRMEMKEYSEARQILFDIKENFRSYFAGNPKAQYAIARSFELENNWKRAEVEYNYLIENYRGSDEAMASFLYVAKYLKDAGRVDESKRWYEDAEKYYNQIAASGEGTLNEAMAKVYLADLFQNQEKWDKSAEILIQIFDKYPQSEPGRKAILKASAIYRSKLNSEVKADSLIEVFKASIADIQEEE